MSDDPYAYQEAAVGSAARSSSRRGPEPPTFSPRKAAELVSLVEGWEAEAVDIDSLVGSCFAAGSNYAAEFHKGRAADLRIRIDQLKRLLPGRSEERTEARGENDQGQAPADATPNTVE